MATNEVGILRKLPGRPPARVVAVHFCKFHPFTKSTRSAYSNIMWVISLRKALLTLCEIAVALWIPRRNDVSEGARCHAVTTPPRRTGAESEHADVVEGHAVMATAMCRPGGHRRRRTYSGGGGR